MAKLNTSEFLVGIDVGGTFTDLIFVSGPGKVDILKVPSDPDNLVGSIMNGIKTLGKQHGITTEELIAHVDRLVHGSTVAANALLERNGAKMGFITTAGFRDTLVMRRMFRENMYDTRAPAPEPLVARNHIFEVSERVDRDGNVVVPLKDADIEAIAKTIEKEGLESIGVCFLFSFRNIKHERRVKQLLKKLLPHLYISLSYEVCPEIRDYERACTTHLNAYLQPPVDRYLGELARRLDKSGLSAGLQVMQSNGGVSDPKAAAKKSVNLMLSGPAGGIIGSAYWGGITGYDNVISFDMGGTSCDISLIRDSAATLSTPITSTSTHCKFEGWDVLIPFIDIHTIGSGGGSIAWLDEGEGLHVGPRSAGADPGPACYAKGGRNATVTDADVLLGYIDPKYYLGGSVELSFEHAQKAVANVADAIGHSVTETADGIFKIVNANMINGIRVVSVERGYDPRDFALLSFGGAGAVHASSLIEEMEVDKAVIPQLAAGFSAFGMLCTDLHRDFVTTINKKLNDVDIDTINQTVRTMSSAGLKHFGAKKRNDKLWIEAVADMRYQGQAHDIRVQIPSTVKTIQQVVNSFNNSYMQSYGYLLEEDSIKLINLRVNVYKSCRKPTSKRHKANSSSATRSLKGKRKVYFHELNDYQDTRVYNGDTLRPGDRFKGPAIVELATTTIVVRPGQTLMMDQYKNYIVGRRGVTL